ncbi:MAG: DUF2238 domain-containing protein [Nanoarchaeota archaeon]|nr:DUF2238 domain-containing protein [Nanoarchaeota archaeon]
MKFGQKEWILLLFNLFYILPFTIFYLLRKNYEFLIYIGVLVLIGIIVISTLKKSKLDYLALWGLSIWGLLHMMGGGVKIAGNTLYSLRLIDIIDKGGQFYILKMDQAIHFYGFLVAAIVVFQLIAPHFKEIKKSKLAIFIAWIGSMGLGALNEVVEFIAFVVVKNTGVGDVYNTGLDLIFNMAGALAGAFIASYWVRRKRQI